jgi:hypothetical protein
MAVGPTPDKAEAKFRAERICGEWKSVWFVHGQDLTNPKTVKVMGLYERAITPIDLGKLQKWFGLEADRKKLAVEYSKYVQDKGIKIVLDNCELLKQS